METKMTDTLLSYEKYNLDDAIVRIHALLDAAPKGKAKDFYLTISEVMTALSFATREYQDMKLAYDEMSCRVKIMEILMAQLVKDRKE